MSKNKIISIANGFGEDSTYIRVGSYYKTKKIDKIERETKTIGKGYYNDLTIDCFAAYDKDGEKLLEINEGQNIEIRYETNS